MMAAFLMAAFLMAATLLSTGSAADRRSGSGSRCYAVAVGSCAPSCGTFTSVQTGVQRVREGSPCAPCNGTFCPGLWSSAISAEYHSEQQVLEALYHATGGQISWNSAEGWLNGSATGCHAPGHCNWDGVGCSMSGAVTSLDLGAHGLKGTIPHQLSSLTQLNSLRLYNNDALSGSIPLQLSSLSQLTEMWVNNDGISGTIPNQLVALSLMSLLHLNNNSISGSVPQNLSAFARLSVLGLSNNAMSGTVPQPLSALTQLVKLQLHNNTQLSGTIPQHLGANCSTTLQQVFWYNTLTSGSIPEDMANLQGLSLLHLATNKLSGTLPKLDRLSSLLKVSAFDNRLHGSISLPNHTLLQSVLLHNNRFSCRMHANNSDNPHLRNRSLVLPGNAISRPLPRWLPMYSVSFLSVEANFEDAWVVQIVQVVAGVALLAMIVGIMTRGRVGRYFWFTPEQPVDCLLALCTKVLAGWSLAVLAFLLPLYVVGANYYDCGFAFLYSTVAYLEDPDMEWAAGVSICAYASIAAWAIVVVRHQNNLQIPEDAPHAPRSGSSGGSSHTLRRIAIMITCWTLVVILLSVPQMLFVVSSTIPPDGNTLGLGEVALSFSMYGAGAVLFLITIIIVPLLGNSLTKSLNGGKPDRNAALHLIMIARIMIALIIPFCAILVLDQACHAQWMRFWQPCAESPKYFETWSCCGGDEKTAASCTGIPQQSLHLMLCSTGFEPTLVVSHDQICSPNYQASRCPRAVVDTLGTLIFEKQVFATFVGVPMALLVLTPQARSGKKWLVRNLLRQHGYEPTTSIDQELVIINLLFDYPLVLGACVPLLVPLSCLCMAQYTAMLHFAPTLGTKFSNIAHPSSSYLWLSGCLGLVLNAWVFFSCGFNGKYLVTIAAPLMAACTAWCSNSWLRGRMQLGSLVLLKAPLLDGTVGNEIQMTEPAVAVV